MTAGIAAASPIAVANSASAMPGATTERLVFCAAAIPAKLRMIPHTVPKRPMNGAAEPSVARNGRRNSRRRSSAFNANPIAPPLRHPPPPHRGSEQQQQRSLDDGVGVQKQFDDRKGRDGVVHDCPQLFISRRV